MWWSQINSLAHSGSDVGFNFQFWNPLDYQCAWFYLAWDPRSSDDEILHEYVMFI